MRLKAKQTKCWLLQHACSEKVNNYYYVTYARIFDDESAGYRKLHWVTMIDSDDIWESLDPMTQNSCEADELTPEDWQTARDNLIGELNSNVLWDIENCKSLSELNDIYRWANETINNYNS
jgi:hypothetical protein